MKKTLVLMLSVLCVLMLSSCSMTSSGIGRATSLSMLNAAQHELEINGVGEIERWDGAAIVDYQGKLEADGLVFRGEVTGVLSVSYVQEQSGDALYTCMVGFEDTEDAETLARYYEKQYKTEIAEGRARVTRNGYVLTVTHASFLLG